MRATYLLNLSGLKYAVWKDEVESVREIATIHQLPFSPPCIAGLAIIEKSSTALADLAALIGLPPFDRESRAQLLLVAGQKKDAGFIFSGEIQEISTPEESILPIPDYVKTTEIRSCIIHQEEAVPLIDLTGLFRHIHSADLNPSLPSFEVPERQHNFTEKSSIRLITSGGDVFALPAEMVMNSTDKPDWISPLPLAPEPIKGLTCAENRIAPVIHLAEKMQLARKGAADKFLTVNIANDNFGFLVDNDLGTFSENDFSLHKVPPLAESSLISSAAIRKREIIPVIDPVSILEAEPSQPDESALAEHYRADSQFGETFYHEEVKVVEFSVLGVNHALPGSEVEDILPISTIRKVPELQSLVIGIVEHQGEILPVLDLALVFGRRSLLDSNWSMILVKNGNFRAFVVTESVHEEKILPISLQKKVPITLPQELVYGCYPDGNIVRLIINVAALAIHFDKKVVEEFISALTKEMAETPAELVPSLLPEEEVARLEIERKEREAREARQREIDEARKLEEEKAAKEDQDRLKMQEDLQARTEENRLLELMEKAQPGVFIEDEAAQSDEKTTRILEEKLDELEAGKDTIDLEVELGVTEEKFAELEAGEDTIALEDEELGVLEEKLAELEASEDTIALEDEDLGVWKETLIETSPDFPVTEETTSLIDTSADQAEINIAEEEQFRPEEEARKAEIEKQKLLAEEHRRNEVAAAEEDRLKLEDEAKKGEEERQRLLDEEQRRNEIAKAEEERHRIEEEARKEEEEKQRLLDEEQRRNEIAKAEEERSRIEEETRKAEEEKQRILNEEQRSIDIAKAEEERSRIEEEQAEPDEETERIEIPPGLIDEREQLEEMLIAGADELQYSAEEPPEHSNGYQPDMEFSTGALKEYPASSEEDTKQKALEKELRKMEAEDERTRILKELETREEKSNKGNKRLIFLIVLLLIMIAGAFLFSTKPDWWTNLQEKEVEPEPAVETSIPGSVIEPEKVAGTGDEEGEDTLSEIIVPTYEAEEDFKEETAPAEPDDPGMEEGVQPETASTTEDLTLTIIVPRNIPLKSQTYTVVRGDTLWHISKRFTGNPYNYPFVARENKIPNPDLIYPKQKIYLKREPPDGG